MHQDSDISQVFFILLEDQFKANETAKATMIALTISIVDPSSALSRKMACTSLHTLEEWLQQRRHIAKAMPLYQRPASQPRPHSYHKRCETVSEEDVAPCDRVFAGWLVTKIKEITSGIGLIHEQEDEHWTGEPTQLRSKKKLIRQNEEALSAVASKPGGHSGLGKRLINKPVSDQFTLVVERTGRSTSDERTKDGKNDTIGNPVLLEGLSLFCQPRLRTGKARR